MADDFVDEVIVDKKERARRRRESESRADRCLISLRNRFDKRPRVERDCTAGVVLLRRSEDRGARFGSEHYRGTRASRYDGQLQEYQKGFEKH